ncbi:hypothetical protein AB0C59_29380 [Streptomyces sp. NPDC048664]|uniref:hypothetical protein n=1 Tax=Streptomyces sp. NPDC048664 TaxID=3154505 RepID=UPI003434C589
MSDRERDRYMDASGHLRDMTEETLGAQEQERQARERRRERQRERQFGQGAGERPGRRERGDDAHR